MKSRKNIPNEFSLEYVNKSHIESFERALAFNPDTDPNEHIVAATELLPFRQPAPSTVEGITYRLFRFPLMIIAFAYILVEVILYLIVRAIVASWEYIVTYLHGRGTNLTNSLREARTYKEWVDTALKLDACYGYDKWKQETPFRYYDYNLLQKVERDLREFREGKMADPYALKNLLLHSVKGNFAGVENTRLYSHTYYGTKRLVDSYIDEGPDKHRLFKLACKNYGRTALCLSGGASFGYYHIGVVRALYDAGLLPSVITGTSSGGLIAALTCTHTNEELEQVLRPEICSRLNACGDSIDMWLKRFWKTGARFSAVDWARKVQWITKGSLTFREAYERTGRILNISVIPYDTHSPPKLLNYITAPDCVIWSAVIASAAVPGILNPVALMQKTADGSLVPYNYGHKWKDGSLRTDIPLQSLYSLFNVKFTIVSQVNPHIHIFFYGPRGSVGRPVAHRKGRGWRGGFLLSSFEQMLKLDLSKWLKVIRDLELMPPVADQDWSSVWLQRFDGNITILPKITVWDYYYILCDPDYRRLSHMITYGQRAAWPTLKMISNRLKIECAIEKGRRTVKRERYRLHRRVECNHPHHEDTENTSESVDSSVGGNSGSSDSGDRNEGNDVGVEYAKRWREHSGLMRKKEHRSYSIPSQSDSDSF
ncbi:10156_t:CDS:2 [Paraglomus brasilianum]|uniref:10156_t:CDS:1 n=1 Tax=Paraglomus brasilianum TaxID=144538 RepID=A0A9N8ZK39_9GLOM|nr:10156_t:CDS:2 [Paraglomus brasilianum]